MGSSNDIEVPARIGRYRIERRLGTGGMAEVFLARSRGASGIEKRLVLKRILPSFASSPRFNAMFVDEAKVAMSLNHPNVVQIYAFEEERRQLLLAMEFVDGVDLAQLLSARRREEQRLPPGLVAWLALELAKGLDYAHRRRDPSGEPLEIVHRDISPQNVLLGREGTVKVADFGIAKARLVADDTGTIKGKFAYMSPEQARGEAVDRRSDVYSLGLLVTEMLLGRPRFEGMKGLEVLERVRRGQRVLPRSVDPALPEALDAIVARATSSAPEGRYPSARDLAHDLEAFLHGLERRWGPGDLESALEALVPRPSLGVSPGSVPSSLADPTRPRAAGGDRRERRGVVALEGLPRAGVLGRRARAVLEDIAFKADAVVRFPEHAGAVRFQMLFGLGRASVTDPLKALAAATDCLDALRGLSVDRGESVEASVGVGRGVVSTVRDPRGRLLRWVPVDAALGIAAALAEAGAPGEVLAAGAVHRLARRDYAFAAAREVEVPTAAGATTRAIAAWPLTRALRGHEKVAGQDRGAVVGREIERAQLETLYAEVRETGRAQFVTVVGELGAGKTALARAALEGLTPPARVLHAECTFGARDVPFEVVTELLRSGLGKADTPEELQAKLGTAARHVLGPGEGAQVAKDLAPLFGGASRRPVEGDADRERTVARAVERWMTGLAQAARSAHDGALVAWVDGLQWADAPSLALLARMSRRTYEVPCLVLLGTRPDPAVLAALRAVPRLELGPLPDAARTALLTKRLGAAPASELRQVLVRRGGGNPFFLLELADAMKERGAIEVEDTPSGRVVRRRSGAPLQLPSTLEGVVAERLDELEAPSRELLQWLAVAGDGIDDDDLAELAETSADEVSAQLQSLVERGFVERRSPGLAFTSAIFREVLYEATEPTDRAPLHRRVAARLRRVSPHAGGRLARHLALAGDRGEAAAAFLDAAEGAGRVHSNREALRFYGRALALLSPDDVEGRFAAHEGRERIFRFLGWDAERAQELAALGRLAAHGGPRRRASAHLRAVRERMDHARYAEALAVLPAARKAAQESGEASLELDAERLEAEIARHLDDRERALAAVARGLARAGDDRALFPARAALLVQRAIVLRRLGQVEASLQAYAEALVIFRRLGIRRSEAFALNGLGVALVSSGDLEDAIIALRASIQIDRETGDRLRLGRKLSNVGQVLDSLGDREQGLAFLRRALDVFDVVDDGGGRCDALAALADILIDAGDDVDAAAEALDEARELAGRLGGGFEVARERVVRARLERHAGRHGAAEAAAREALDAARRGSTVNYEVHALAELALAQAAQGSGGAEALSAARARVADAGQALEQIERVLDRLARAAMALGDQDAARALESEARRHLERRAQSLRSASMRRRYLASSAAKAILRPEESR